MYYAKPRQDTPWEEEGKLMDDLKLHGKSESEIKGLMSTVEVFSQDTGVEFSIEKCGVIIMNRGKVQSTDGMKLPSGKKMRETEEDGYKYLEILEYDRIKEQVMKDKSRNSISGGQN